VSKVPVTDFLQNFFGPGTESKMSIPNSIPESVLANYFCMGEVAIFCNLNIGTGKNEEKVEYFSEIQTNMNVS